MIDYVKVFIFILCGFGTIVMAEDQHGAGVEHAEGHHFHKNHISMFLGATQAEKHHGERDDPGFSIGIDYERRLNQVIGVGFLADWVVEGNREYLLGIPLFLHVGRHAKFQLAPGWHKLNEEHEDGWVFRTGFGWGFEVGKITLTPALYYDITENENIFVAGLEIGKGW